jgi:hypothetical protein
VSRRSALVGHAVGRVRSLVDDADVEVSES